MLYVIFVHSHLYFKNPHLVTHFFCLEHSFVHIFVSTSHKASGSLSAQKRKQQQENKWDCYINWTLEHFRSSGCLPPCAGHAEQYSRLCRLGGGSGFWLWHGCLKEGQQERVELQCMSGGCVRNCSHFMRNLYPRWYYKQSSSHFFPLSTSFCLYLTHPHMLNLLCLCKKYDLTPRPLSMLRWKCRQMKMLCILPTSNNTESASCSVMGGVLFVFI